MSFTEYFSIKEVREELDKVVHDLSTGGLYAPMMKRIAVRIDDSRPAAMVLVMDAKGAPMCTDGQTIGVSVKNLHRIVNEAKTEWHSSHPQYDWYTNSVYEEIRNILIHELTHAICRHSAQGLKVFTERYQKSHQKVLAKELACWTIACEIEANRGYGIAKTSSPIYEVGVTEEKYPYTHDAKYLLDIFHRVLDKYQDQVEKDMEAIKQALEESLKKAAEKGNKTSKEQGNQKGDSNEQSDSNAKPGSVGQSSQQAGETSESRSGGHDEGQSSSGNGQATEKVDQPTPEDQARREALKKLLEETLDEGNGITPEMIAPNSERNHEKVFNAHGAAYQHGGGDIDGDYDPSNKRDYEVLEEAYKEWQSQNVKKVLAKLKGTVVGQVSKNRVATYSRQARRDTSDGLLKKGHKRERRSSPKILLALDKSGSMSHTSTRKATEAVADIFDTTGRPTDGCWICLHDGCVRDVKPMKQWKQVVDGFYPNGGNDFSDVIRLANKLKVDVVLNVGDGGDYTSRDKKAAKEFKQANREWYDINIADIGRSVSTIRDNGEMWKNIYTSDRDSGGIHRKFIDLTGAADFGEELDEIFTKH